MTTVNRARSTTTTVGRRARFAATAALAMLLTLTGCQQQQEPTPTAPPPPTVSHDTDELARTFPALGAPVAASWITWGNSGVGAESSRLELNWIDAVVQVTPATMGALVTEHESQQTDQRPAVQKVLEPDVPPGPFLAGVDLNIAFGGDRRSTRVFLDQPRNIVVLQSSLAG